MNHVDLPSLGWCAFFQSQLSSFESSLHPARVAAEHRGRLQLWSESGELFALTPHDSDDPPRVGDWVLFEPPATGALARIRARLERRSALERQAAGKRTARQVVAANLDMVFVLTSMNQDFNLRRVERYLAAVRAGGAEPAVVLTKSDLRPSDVPRHLRQLETVAGDAPVLAASALYREGLDDLRALLATGRTVGLVGSSGVGKSTLLNALIGEDVSRTQAIRASDERGTHTTTGRSLHLLPDGGGLLLDTPGMRELALWSGDGLEATFADVEALAASCRFRDCQHEGEPGCAVLDAIERGELDPGRLEGHRKLQREAAWQEARVDVFQRREQRRAFAKMVKSAGKARW